MLRIYTRAVNREDEKRGPLFHQPTKAICLSEPDFDLAYFRNHFGIIGKAPIQEKDYLSICFDYIHSNPVTGKLVENPGDWEFSSFSDYFFGREGTLVNRELAEDLGLLYLSQGDDTPITDSMKFNHLVSDPVHWIR